MHAVTFRFECLQNRADSRLVEVFELSSQGIGEHFSSDLASEIIELFMNDDVSQSDRTLETCPTWQAPFCIDGVTIAFQAPSAKPIKIFKSKADGIHFTMA